MIVSFAVGSGGNEKSEEYDDVWPGGVPRESWGSEVGAKRAVTA
jgi:hypothetical protein